MIGEGRCLGSVYVGRCCKDLWRRRRRRRHACSVQVGLGGYTAGRATVMVLVQLYWGERTGREVPLFYLLLLSTKSSGILLFFFSCCEHSYSCFLDSVLRSGFAAAQEEDNFEEEVHKVFDFWIWFSEKCLSGRQRNVAGCSPPPPLGGDEAEEK